MLRVLIVGIGGFALGYWTSTLLLPKQPSPDSLTPEARQVPPLARMSRDMLNACEDMRPLLLQLEAAVLDDGSIDPAEWYAIYRQSRRLI